MNVLIIEDERPASQKLVRLLNQIDNTIKVLDILESVEQSVNWFSDNPTPDLIFMDIQLEDGISFEIFDNCKIETPVIFTTAYDEYTLKAFKVNSIDYLLKPIVVDELKVAINKYYTSHKASKPSIDLTAVIKQLQPKTKERFLIKVGEHLKSIQTSDINCFYVIERCNFILVNTGKNYPIDFSLDKIEETIDSKIFFRVSRNCIINIFAIKDIIAYSSSRLKVTLNQWTEKEEIIVSRERVNAFKQWMDR